MKPLGSIKNKKCSKSGVADRQSKFLKIQLGQTMLQRFDMVKFKLIEREITVEKAR
jgi:hypothetical protein